MVPTPALPDPVAVRDRPGDRDLELAGDPAHVLAPRFLVNVSRPPRGSETSVDGRGTGRSSAGNGGRPSGCCRLSGDAHPPLALGEKPGENSRTAGVLQPPLFRGRHFAPAKKFPPTRPGPSERGSESPLFMPSSSDDPPARNQRASRSVSRLPSEGVIIDSEGFAQRRGRTDPGGVSFFLSPACLGEPPDGCPGRTRHFGYGKRTIPRGKNRGALREGAFNGRSRPDEGFFRSGFFRAAEEGTRPRAGGRSTPTRGELRT